MTDHITIDFETRSYADLTKVGAWAYSEHATTEVICGAYKLDDGPTQTWWPDVSDTCGPKELEGDQSWPPDKANHPCYNALPYDLFKAIEEGATIEAHNVGFERSIWANVLVPDLGWPEVPDETQWMDSMAVGSYYSLPPALDKLNRALGGEGKDPEGGRLISKYSKLNLKTASPFIPLEDFHKFVAYCAVDVDREYAVSAYLGPLPEFEERVFWMDQRINMRGIRLNSESINNAREIATKRAAELAERFKEITGLQPTQRDKVMDWFESQDCPLMNMKAEYLQEVLDGEHNFMPTGLALEALKIRMSHAKASTKKLDAMARNRSKDGRARFQVRYHGAGTGRWTGTGFQPLNMNKGYEDVNPAQLVADLAFRDPKILDMLYGDAMDAVSKATRHHIVPESGSRIMAGDYVSVEAVILACLAGEQWKIEAFHRGDPIYELMGCSIHNLPQSALDLALRDKKAFKDMYPAQRFDGKTGELAFGYGGGLGAWRNFDSSDTHTDERVEEIKNAWRDKHPAIKSFWYALQEAATSAVRSGEREAVVQYLNGQEIVNEYIAFEMVDEWLTMILPSGKRLWYFAPEIRMGMPKWHDPKKNEECAAGVCSHRPVAKLTYMAQKEGQWRRVDTYGGKLAENATQAVSREVLVRAMLKLEEAGYSIILSVYDEVVTELKESFGSVAEFTRIMLETREQWYADWPLFVDVWEGYEYKK